MTDVYPACRPAQAASNLCGEISPPQTITATTTTTTQPQAHGLPVTGGDVGGLATLGLGAALVGAAITRRVRVRRAS